MVGSELFKLVLHQAGHSSRSPESKKKMYAGSWTPPHQLRRGRPRMHSKCSACAPFCMQGEDQRVWGWWWGAGRATGDHDRARRHQRLPLVAPGPCGHPQHKDRPKICVPLQVRLLGCCWAGPAPLGCLHCNSKWWSCAYVCTGTCVLGSKGWPLALPVLS